MSYLSYSGYSTLESCPFKYYLKYVAKIKVAENGVSSLYGSVVGSVFEAFYVKRLWRSPDVTEALMSEIPAALETAYKGVAKQGRYLTWRSDLPPGTKSTIPVDEPDLLREVRHGIVNGLQSIRMFQLIGHRVGAEVDLTSKVYGHTLGGRADFIISRTSPRNETVILDGKGSVARDNYVSLKQLLWYAMLYEIHTGLLPERVGWLFWRFVGTDALQWEEFSPKDTEVMLGSAITSLDRISASEVAIQSGANPVEVFPPTPSSAACRWCPYGDHCSAGSKLCKGAAL